MQTNSRWHGHTFDALQCPNYRLWFIGQLVSLFGTWMQSTAQGYLAFQLTRSSAFLGYVAFASGVPTWLFTLYAGAVADRMPRRRLIIMTESAMMALAFILALLAFTGLVRPWHILVLAFLLGAANTFEAPARLAFVDELVDSKDYLPNAVALNGSMFNMATAVGPAVAGGVYAGLGASWCFTINGFSFVAVIIALALMRLRPVRHDALPGNLTSGVVQGLQYTWKHPDIRALLLLVGVTSLFGLSFTALIPAWAVNVLHGSAATGATITGLLQSARGVGAMLAALLNATISHLKIKGRLLTVGFFLYPLALLFFALAHGTVLSLLLIGLVGFGSILVVNLSSILVQTRVEDIMRGRVMAVYNLVFVGIMPIGSLLIGWLAQGAGDATAVLVTALLALTTSVCLFFFVPRLRAIT